MEAEDTALTVTMHNGQLYCVQSVEVYLYARGTVHAFIDWNHACMHACIHTIMQAHACRHKWMQTHVHTDAHEWMQTQMHLHSPLPQ